MDVVQLDDVTVRYGAHSGTRALDGVTLHVRAGERVALLGPSGAGKTTVLRVIAGRVLPADGRAAVLGHDTVELAGRAGRRIRRRIGTIHQDLSLTDPLRVLHNVNAGRLGEWSTARALRSLVVPVGREQALAALGSVDAADLIDARTDQLSGGQRQRVAIARLLVQDPDVVLADEPAASLDPELARSAVALLAERVASPGRALVLSLHDPALARAHCTRLVGLRAGEVVFDRPAQDVAEEDLDTLYRR